MTGELYVFEGPDGVGKSTLARLFAHALRAQGREVRLLAFPGNDPGSLGEVVYRIHHEPGQFGLSPVRASALQALHVAAHADVIEGVIRPALEQGTVIVLDRFWWSTWVYGRVGGLSEAQLGGLLGFEEATWGNLRAQSVFLVTRPDAEDVVSPELVAEYDLLAERQEATGTVVRLVNNDDPEVVVGRALSAFAPHPTSRATDSGLRPARPSVVYDTFWEFAAKRQAIFYTRAAGKPPPWTDDPILAEFKFTNVYRAADRVSQYLIRNVIYDEDRDIEDQVFRILLFKLFNRIETWEFLCREFGEPSWRTFDLHNVDGALERAMTSGTKIYSGAYIMASGARAFKVRRKHSAHLRVLERMMEDGLPARMAKARSLSRVFELLLGYPTLGPFLAFQFAIDLNYAPFLEFDEDDFVVAGPGALDGISKCFTTTAGLSAEEVIRVVTERQEAEFKARGLDFSGLWGRPMHLIDVQNVFCEISKYARRRHPSVEGRAGRTRIKQRFTPTCSPIDYWFPPKWGLADAIASWRAGLPSSDEAPAAQLTFAIPKSQSEK